MSNRRALARFAALSLAVAGFAFAGGCTSGSQHAAADTCCDADAKTAAPLKAADMGPEIKEAVAVIRGTKGNDGVKGTVKFTDTGKGVQVVAHIEGLPASAEIGFHVHEFGDGTAEDGASAGGHFNPTGHQHGAPGETAHAGDMGNIKTDAKGVGHHEVLLPIASLSGKNALLGRGVIVHGKTDDLKSQPAGNAGPRIGFGVIGVAQIKK